MSFMTDVIIYSAKSTKHIISENSVAYKVHCTLLEDVVEPVCEEESYCIHTDICLIYDKKGIYVIEEPSNRSNVIICRCKDAELKEILINYFLSEKIKEALKCIENDFLKLPLFISGYADEELIEYVNLLVNRRTDDILKRNSLATRILNKVLTKTVNTSILKKNIIENGILYEEKKSLQCIVEDIDELNACYKAKAYKATLILAGSILEAFLIDWISEIHEKDYFTYSFTKELKDKNGRVYVAKNALVAYIEEIKDINKPEWLDEADKAEEIREKRNLVHARCCLKKDVEINGDTCKMVIDYLKDIINTRYMKKYGMSYEGSAEVIYTEEKWNELKWNYEEMEKYFLSND